MRTPVSHADLCKMRRLVKKEAKKVSWEKVIDRLYELTAPECEGAVYTAILEKARQKKFLSLMGVDSEMGRAELIERLGIEFDNMTAIAMRDFIKYLANCWGMKAVDKAGDVKRRRSYWLNR